jgi:hypothetical protein
MKTFLLSAAVILLSLGSDSAQAANPCQVQLNQYNTALNRYNSADRALIQQETRYDQMQDQIINGTTQRELQVENAQAYLQYVNSLPITAYGTCLNWRLVAIIQCTANRNARRRQNQSMANLNLVRAQRNLDAYVKSSQVQLKRQSDRVANAQATVDQRQAELDQAEANYDTCLQQSS